MSSIFALRAMLFVGECFVASSAIFALAWFTQRFLRSASQRHLVWLTAFALMIAFPLAVPLVPGAIVIAVDPPSVLTAHVPMTSVAAASVIDAPSQAIALPAFDPEGVALLVFALWFAGFGWQMLRLAIGAHALRSLRHSSRPHSVAPSVLPKVDFRGRECELRLHAGDEGPMTWGFGRAIVLLPEASLNWSAECMGAVLLHELAHVRRLDSLTQALARVVAAIYWMNPLVWTSLRALAREAEMASDDAVLGFGFRPSSYAGELVRLASEFRSHHLAVSGVPMASPSALAARVKSVLATDASRNGATKMDILKIGSIGFAVTALLALAHPALGDERDTVSADPAPARDAPTVQTPPPAAAHSGSDRHRIILLDGDPAEARRAVAQAQAELARIQPDIEKAMADAKIDEKVARAMADAHIDQRMERAMAEAHVDEKVAHAMADAHIDERIQRAMAEVHVDEKVAQAMADAQPRIRIKIQHAMAQADAAMHQAMADLQKARPAFDAAMARRHHLVVRLDDNTDVEHNDEASENRDADVDVKNSRSDDRH